MIVAFFIHHLYDQPILAAGLGFKGGGNFARALQLSQAAVPIIIQESNSCSVAILQPYTPWAVRIRCAFALNGGVAH
jgi:hypothetical protein